ncbi:hypothetical protein EYC84_006509 [Monilinia fructicola]|uniref:Uncharacterized protein n=1 Tax=Monilinia fructicola TaxID=38448 RepID=A0A5M9K3M0_MONFR|nr:hypothetical protein EYC84_006509 [Monilinia fructicola]
MARLDWSFMLLISFQFISFHCLSKNLLLSLAGLRKLQSTFAKVVSKGNPRIHRIHRNSSYRSTDYSFIKIPKPMILLPTIAKSHYLRKK